MRMRTVILIVFTLMVGQLGWSQTKSLGDVAGSIKLNPEAIVDQRGAIEEPRVDKKADSELFSDSLNSCSLVADQLGEMIDEARNTIRYGDSDLPNRLGAAALDLDTEAQGIYLLRLTDGFAQPSTTAREAADDCTAASKAVREELARNGVAFTAAKDTIARCRQGLGLARTQLDAVEDPAGAEKAAAATAASGPVEPPTDDEIVAVRCEKERPAGAGAVEACRSAQFEALAAISSRSSANEMIDAEVFDDIRRICESIHASDFAQRDDCEIDKMTAVRLESE